MTVPAVLRKKEKKILITLNAFEDEQSNYKAGCGQMWLTGGPGPVGVGKWVVRTNSLSWDVKKNRARRHVTRSPTLWNLEVVQQLNDVVCRL